MSLLALQVAAAKKLETRCFFGRQLLTGIALSVKNVYLHELARFSSERHYHEIKSYGGASFAWTKHQNMFETFFPPTNH